MASVCISGMVGVGGLVTELLARSHTTFALGLPPEASLVARLGDDMTPVLPLHKLDDSQLIAALELRGCHTLVMAWPDPQVHLVRRLCAAAVRAGVKAVVFLSASEVYLGRFVEPRREGCVYPLSNRALRWLQAERLVRKCGLATAVLRPFQVYGTYGDWSAPYSLPAAWQKVGAIPEDAGGDFLHIADLAALVAMVTTGLAQQPAQLDLVLNAGTGNWLPAPVISEFLGIPLARPTKWRYNRTADVTRLRTLPFRPQLTWGW